MSADTDAAFVRDARIRLEVADLGNNRGLILDLLDRAEHTVEERDRVVRASNAGAEKALRRIAELEEKLRYVGIDPNSIGA